MTNITTRIIDLTPAMGAALIGRNTRNRHMSGTNYQKVRRSIERDEWSLNGEAVKISDTGVLLDGQHRCMAVVETGKTIQTILIEGLPESAQDTMDTGKPRTLGNVLHMRGYKSAPNLAAGIRRMLLAERDGIKWAFARGTASTTRPEELSWFEENPWIENYTQASATVAKDRDVLLSPTSTLVLMVMFDGCDEEDAEFFWEKLRSGESLSDQHPIMALRRAFKRQSDLKGEHDQYHLAGLTIKAWNKYRKGQPASLIRFKSGGANPDRFPEPI